MMKGMKDWKGKGNIRAWHPRAKVINTRDDHPTSRVLEILSRNRSGRVEGRGRGRGTRVWKWDLEGRRGGWLRLPIRVVMSMRMKLLQFHDHARGKYSSLSTQRAG